jgi:hypothetical protein
MLSLMWQVHYGLIYLENNMKIIIFLKGKKTFIIGVLMIALGLLTDNKEMVLQGLGFITLRAGINGAR